MTVDIRGSLIISDCETEYIVEIGNLSYKSSGACVYLPKAICNVLHLNPAIDNKLVVVSFDTNSVMLLKDNEIVTALKPKLLDARKLAMQKLKPEDLKVV